MPKPQAATIEERFNEFHGSHPEVWTLFVRFSHEVMTAGHEHYSADAVLHRVRWEADIGHCQDAEGYKINNNYSAFYARLFHREYPQHDGFFRTRVSQADRRPDEPNAPAVEATADYTAPPAEPPAPPWPDTDDAARPGAATAADVAADGVPTEDPPADPRPAPAPQSPMIVHRGFGSVPARHPG